MPIIQFNLSRGCVKRRVLQCGRRGFSEQVPLAEIAAQGLQHIELFHALYAFRYAGDV